LDGVCLLARQESPPGGEADQIGGRMCAKLAGTLSRIHLRGDSIFVGVAR